MMSLGERGQEGRESGAGMDGEEGLEVDYETWRESSCHHRW